MSNPTNKQKNTGFGAGLFLGTLFGGASLFFFGTKTGKKVKNQIRKEIENGDLDLDKAKRIAHTQINKVIKELNLKDSLARISKTTKSKPKPPTSKNKKFFVSKGKKLGKS